MFKNFASFFEYSSVNFNINGNIRCKLIYELCINIFKDSDSYLQMEKDTGNVPSKKLLISYEKLLIFLNTKY